MYCFWIAAPYLTLRAYFILTPILALSLYLTGYSLFLGSILSGVFVWRHIRISNISKDRISSPETNYLIITAALAIFMFFVIKEDYLILFVFLQVVNLFLGNVFSHLAVTAKENLKHFNYKIIIYFIGAFILAISTTIYFLTFSQSFLFQLWIHTIYFVFSLIGRFLELFQFVKDINIKKWFEHESGTATEVLASKETLEPFLEMLAPGATLYLIIMVILFVTGLILLFLIFKRDKEVLVKMNINDQSNQVIKKIVYDERVSYFKTLFNTQKSPAHFIRKKIYQFERKANKVELGRKPYETLEEWLNRLGVSSYFNTYQKVRYGEGIVNQVEIEVLLEELKHAEKRLKKF